MITTDSLAYFEGLIRLVSEDGGDEDLWQLPDVFFSVNRRTQRYGVGMM